VWHGVVNVFDLSAMHPGSGTNSTDADLNYNGTINVLGLSPSSTGA